VAYDLLTLVGPAAVATFTSETADRCQPRLETGLVRLQIVQREGLNISIESRQMPFFGVIPRTFLAQAVQKTVLYCLSCLFASTFSAQQRAPHQLMEFCRILVMLSVAALVRGSADCMSLTDSLVSRCARAPRSTRRQH